MSLFDPVAPDGFQHVRLLISDADFALLVNERKRRDWIRGREQNDMARLGEIVGETIRDLKTYCDFPSNNPASLSLWVVGKVHDDGSPWELMGIFDTEEKAVAACTTPNHFVGPETLNVRLPEERVEWPGSYYPMLKQVGDEPSTLRLHRLTALCDDFDFNSINAEIAARNASNGRDGEPSEINRGVVLGLMALHAKAFRERADPR